MLMGITEGLFTHRKTDSSSCWSTSITWKDSFKPLTKLFSIRLPVFPIIGMAVLHSYIWFLKYWASKVLFNQYWKHYLVPRWWLLLFKTPCSQIWDNLESANIFHCKVDPSKDKSVCQYVYWVCQYHIQTVVVQKSISLVEIGCTYTEQN